MKKDYTLLLIGQIDSIYIINFAKYLKLENPNARIFFWGPLTMKKNNSDKYLEIFDDCYLFREDLVFAKVPVLRFFESVFRWQYHFKKYTKTKNIDIVNIHYVFLKYSFLLKNIRDISAKLVLTPWGSDVYRTGGLNRYFLKKLYNKADYISGVNNRFTKDLMGVFNIPKEKILYFDLGSEAIDYILDHKELINTEDAKRKLGIDDSTYTITCGYNASPAQRHLQIIESISKIREQLPSNLVLLFPFTYGGNKLYKDVIRQEVLRRGLKALFLEEFLSLPDLFSLRLATDMFIHVQTTDANSTSLAEYLICGKKVINGSWLRYKELETNGILPYFIVNTMGDLGTAIINAFNARPIVLDNDTINVINAKSCSYNALKSNMAFESIL